VDGGHETLNNGELPVSSVPKGPLNQTYVVVDDLGERSQTVGGTRGVGDDLVLGLVSLEVNTTDEPICQSSSRLSRE